MSVDLSSSGIGSGTSGRPSGPCDVRRLRNADAVMRRDRVRRALSVARRADVVHRLRRATQQPTAKLLVVPPYAKILLRRSSWAPSFVVVPPWTWWNDPSPRMVTIVTSGDEARRSQRSRFA